MIRQLLAIMSAKFHCHSGRNLYGVILWIFTISCLLIHITDLLELSDLDKNNAISFLYTNIGALVTIFAITMSVTLLGLQFQAHSYTMVGLIQSIKHRVVYGFISVFLVLVWFSLIAATHPSLINPVTAVPYAVLGTIFSLLYVPGYIYFIAYRVQPEQIIKTIAKDFKNIELQIIAGESDILSKKPRSFQVWEQIMYRAMENYNIVVFKSGMEMILASALRCRQSCQEEQRDPVGRFFITYISGIMTTAVRTDRKRFVSLFMFHFKKTYESIPENGDLHAHRHMIFHIWEQTMNEAILLRNTWIQRLGMFSMQDVIEKCMQQTDSRQTKLAIEFLHTYIYRLTYTALYEGHDNFLVLYMENWPRYCPLANETEDSDRWDYSTADCCLGGTDDSCRKNRKPPSI